MRNEQHNRRVSGRLMQGLFVGGPPFVEMLLVVGLVHRGDGRVKPFYCDFL